MDAYAKALMQLGLRGMIGKGYRQDHVKQAIMDYQSIYFGAIGGSEALILDNVFNLVKSLLLRI